MVQAQVELTSSDGQATVLATVLDDIGLAFGKDKDAVLVLRSTSLSADAELNDVIEGTSDHQGVAANSLIISNITDDGDIIILVSDGGTSKEAILVNADVADLQLGHGMATVVVKTASGDITVDPENDLVISLSDAAGARTVFIKDSGGNIVATIDSDGNARFGDATAPTAELEVAGGAQGSIHLDATGNAFMTIDKGGAGNNALLRYQAAGTTIAYFGLFAGNDYMDWLDGSAGRIARMTVSTGHVRFGDGTVPDVNAEIVAGGAGIIGMVEGTTPTATADMGKIYSKNDNKLYFQDGAGVEHEVAFV